MQRFCDCVEINRKKENIISIETGVFISLTPRKKIDMSSPDYVTVAGAALL